MPQSFTVGGTVVTLVDKPPSETPIAHEPGAPLPKASSIKEVVVCRVGGAAFRRVGQRWVPCGVIDVIPPTVEQLAQLEDEEPSNSETGGDTGGDTDTGDTGDTGGGTNKHVNENNPGNLTYEDISAMSKGELKALAKECGLSTDGSKPDLFNNVAEYLGVIS